MAGAEHPLAVSVEARGQLLHKGNTTLTFFKSFVRKMYLKRMSILLKMWGLV